MHEIYRQWRALADSYDEPRVFVAEAWVAQPERLARYVRADELHTAFNFDFLLTPWRREPLRASIAPRPGAARGVGAPPTWVLSNHDVAREVSRYARPQGVRVLRHLDDLLDLPADFDSGPAPGPGGGAADAGPARRRLRLPGRGARAGRGRGPARGGAAGSRPGSSPGIPTAGATAPGADPVVGPAAAVRLQPRPAATRRPGCPSRARGARSPSRRRPATRGSMLELYRARSRSAASSRRSATARLRWRPRPRRALAFARDPRLPLHRQPVGRPDPGAGGQRAAAVQRRPHLAAELPPDTTVWLEV